MVLLFNVPNLAYEYTGFRKDLSISGSLSFADDWYVYKDTEATGFIVVGEIKRYFWHARNSSRYFSATIRFQNMTYEGNNDRVLLRRPGLAISYGREWLLWRHLLIDGSIGGSYYPDKYKVKFTDGVVDISLPNFVIGLGLRVNCSIGWQF